MNTMIAVPIAAAMPAAPVSNETSAEACSFPDLAARFLCARERWSEQRESDDARMSDVDDEVWNGIHAELEAIADAMLQCEPRSAIDLAWQAEALWLADLEYREEPDQELPRRLVENIRKLAGPLPIPSVIPAANPDPIFAAIDAHKEVFAEFRKCIQSHTGLEVELPCERRQSRIAQWGEQIIETDDPRWIAAERSVMQMSAAADDTAFDLLSVEPTSHAGAAALLRYFTDADDEAMFPERVAFDDDDEYGIRFGQALARHVADALDRLVQFAPLSEPRKHAKAPTM